MVSFSDSTGPLPNAPEESDSLIPNNVTSAAANITRKARRRSKRSVVQHYVENLVVVDHKTYNRSVNTPTTLYSTEACIPEFSIGECMVPNILKISYEEK